METFATATPPALLAGAAQIPRPRLVVHIMARWNNCLLFARRSDSGLWVLPAGIPRPGEPASAAAGRIVHSQVGLSLDPSCTWLVHTQHNTDGASPANPQPFGTSDGLWIGGNERVDLFFQPGRFRGIPVILDRAVYDHLGWYHPERMPQGVPPYLAAAVEARQTSEPYRELGWPAVPAPSSAHGS